MYIFNKPKFSTINFSFRSITSLFRKLVFESLEGRLRTFLAQLSEFPGQPSIDKQIDRINKYLGFDIKTRVTIMGRSLLSQIAPGEGVGGLLTQQILFMPELETRILNFERHTSDVEQND